MRLQAFPTEELILGSRDKILVSQGAVDILLIVVACAVGSWICWKFGDVLLRSVAKFLLRTTLKIEVVSRCR